MAKISESRAWGWVPSLYFIEGLPYVMVMTLSVAMYKRLGVGNAEIAFYTAWLYLPWVIKLLWSPYIDAVLTKRRWIILTQWLLAGAFAAVAFALPGPGYFRISLCAFWFVAFASATHDIAADGFYMLALNENRQSFFVGIRTLAYRMAMLFGQGGLVVFAGMLEKRTGDIPMSWAVTMGVVSLIMAIAALWHSFILPHPESDKPQRSGKGIGCAFVRSFVSFFKKPQAATALLFMLLYRLPEAQLVKLIYPFMLDPRSEGGLGMSTTAVGTTYGVYGLVALLAGGIIGGFAVARGGLRRWLKPMAWSMSLTCLTFVYLSFFNASPGWVVDICVVIEQFGYGFGTTAYTLYLIYYAIGPYKTSHYAIATGFMALGMMLPGMAAGAIQEYIGYRAFFLWTMICCAATLAVTYYIHIDPSFGLKRKSGIGVKGIFTKFAGKNR